MFISNQALLLSVTVQTLFDAAKKSPKHQYQKFRSLSKSVFRCRPYYNNRYGTNTANIRIFQYNETDVELQVSRTVIPDYNKKNVAAVGGAGVFLEPLSLRNAAS